MHINTMQMCIWEQFQPKIGDAVSGWIDDKFPVLVHCAAGVSLALFCTEIEGLWRIPRIVALRKYHLPVPANWQIE